MNKFETKQGRRVKMLMVLFDCKEQKDLAAFFNVNKTQVTRWVKNGFSPSVENVIDSLLEIPSVKKKIIKLGA